MATIFFGASSPVYTANGNWQDINQWYSNLQNGSGKSITAATLLGRFPNAATDTVFLAQDVKSNVGTYTGTYPSGTWTTGTYAGSILGYAAKIDDPNATWSGAIRGYPNFCRGTFTGDLSGIGTYYLNGGTFTNTVIFNTGTANYNFNEYSSIGSTTTPNALTLPTGFSISNTQQIQISRSITYDFPITWATGTSVYYQLYIYSGEITKRFPIFTRDMSTAATGCLNYAIRGSPLVGQPVVPLDLSTVFTNTATFTIGTPTRPAYFNFYDVQFSRPTVVYTGVGYISGTLWNQGGTFNTNWYGAGLQSLTFTNITLLTPQGFSPAAIYVNITGTYIVTATVAVLPSLQGTKHIVDANTLLYGYNFGPPTTSGSFRPTENLAVTANIGAILE